MPRDKTRKMRGGATSQNSKMRANYIFNTNRLSTLANTDQRYVETGIIHVTESDASGLFREIGTGVANVFGRKGFDNSIIDKARNKALEKIQSMLKPNQKVCGLRVEMTNQPNLFFVHLVGTLLELKQ